MKNLDFKYIAAKNFVCFGSEGIELDLHSFGNIVLIHGKNLDVSDGSGEDSRNGVGKSTIPDIIVYTLYGKPLKKGLSHSQVINYTNKKKLRTEVRWDKYRVVRTRSPDGLRMWENEDDIWDLHVICPTTDEKIVVSKKADGKATNSKGDTFDYLESDIIDSEITLGGMPATQKLIEKKIGLNCVTFCNVVVFIDDNSCAFLECDAKTKRDIVENLMSLEKYRDYNEKAKEARNIAKRKIADIGKEYERMILERGLCIERKENVEKEEIQWKQTMLDELRVIYNKITEKEAELESTDMGKALAEYNKAQEKIKLLNAEIPPLEAKKSKVDSILSEAEGRLEESREKKQALIVSIQNINTEIQNGESFIRSNQDILIRLKNDENTKCDKCFGVISKENVDIFEKESKNETQQWEEIITENKKRLATLTEEKTAVEESIKQLLSGIEAARESSREASNKISTNRQEISQWNIVKEPEVGAKERILEDQVEELRKQGIKKHEEYKGPSPYAKLHAAAIQELDLKKNEVDSKSSEMKVAEAELPYYEFWVKAFGDKGIRKFIIDGIIPALNSRTAYWLQFLIDGKINLIFDNQLEETIERCPPDGDPFVYAQMSMGEKRRLNLTVSQAFAHVMMLNSGCIPSCVFLDEVTTNIDPIGVVGVYNMITELSKNRQVFVTTHDQGLLEMLSGCDTINLVRKDGFTKLVS